MTGALYAEAPPVPRVQVRFNSLQFKYGELGGSGLSAKPSLQWTLGLQCDPPWRVAYVHMAGTRPEVKDSRGTCALASRLSFCTAQNHKKSAMFRGDLYIFGEKWSPDPHATWISVQGCMPVGVSCSEKLSEKITLSLKNGVKVPMVLKGAALGKKSDVPAVVTVEYCHPQYWKGKEGVAGVIRVKTPVPCGIKEMELFTKDGKQDDQTGFRKFYEAFSGDYGQYTWLQNIWVSLENRDQFKIAVKYADGLQEVIVPVSFKVGMGGMVFSGEKEKGKEGEGR